MKEEDGRHSHSEEPEGCCHEKKGGRFPVSRLTRGAVTAALLLAAASYFVPVLAHFRFSFFHYVRVMGLPILAGVLAGGFVDYFVPHEWINRFLQARRWRTVFYSAGLGFLFSACSHGMLAIAMEMHRKGASGSAVVSFLLASPWANLPFTILILGMFGAKGMAIVLAALLVAVLTGLALQEAEKRGWVESNPNSAAPQPAFSMQEQVAGRIAGSRKGIFNLSRWGRAAAGISRASWSLADMILGWILIGMMLASLVSVLVPSWIFSRYLGGSISGLMLTVALATVLEVCSEGTAPLALEIYKQTGAFGNVFVFLMGGVVTDYTEIGLLWTHLGKRTALWTLFLALPQVIFLGMIFNQIF